ncbi:flavin reductase family protein [Nanoarchaeota archaeon]
MNEFVNPRQAIVVTTRGEVDLMGKKVLKDNAFTLTWHAPLSHDPFLYGISVHPKRFSYKLIEASKVFVVNFVPHESKDDVFFVGTESGMGQDKFSKTKWTKEDAEHIDCCRIKEASAYLECEIIDQFPVGDHIFFVGKVLKHNINDDKKRLFYMGGGRFTSTI